MKLKAVCINLETSENRKQHMLNVADKMYLPFEFFKAYDYKNLELVSPQTTSINIIDPGNNDDYIIDVGTDGENCGSGIKKIYYNGEFTGLYHDPKKYLQDQVEHFGRKHFQDYQNIPHAEPIRVIDYDGDLTKKWINYKGESLFYVDISNFRKYIAKAEIACALSHYKVLEKLLQDDEYDAYLILEDDVVYQEYDSEPDYNLKNVLDELELYSSLWDIAYLNDPKFLSINSLIPYNKYWNLGVYSNFTDACSYIVTKKTAKKLIDLYNKHIDLCADDFLTRQVTFFSLRTKKPIFLNNLSNDSTIRTPEIENEMEDLFQKYNQGIVFF